MYVEYTFSSPLENFSEIVQVTALIQGVYEYYEVSFNLIHFESQFT